MTDTKTDTKVRTAPTVRMVTDRTPVYAAVGLSDIVVERLRGVTDSALRVGQQTSRQLRPDTLAQHLKGGAGELNTQATKLLNQLAERVQRAPGAVAGEAGELQERVDRGYQDLADRGEKLVERIRKQQAAQELAAQLGALVEQGKGLVGTVRKGARDTTTAAKATVTTGRREAAEGVAEVVAGQDVELTPAEDTKAKPARRTSTRKAPATRKAQPAGASKPSATRSAAKRTATTARKRATEAAGSAADVAAETAKTAAKTAEATREAASKIGD